MLADEALDFVDIATTMESHEALPRAGLRRRRPGDLPEADGAGTSAACRRMVARAEGAGLAFMGAIENFRFQAPLIGVGQALTEGLAGGGRSSRMSASCTGYDVVAGQPYLAQVERFILLDRRHPRAGLVARFAAEATRGTTSTPGPQADPAGAPRARRRRR